MWSEPSDLYMSVNPYETVSQAAIVGIEEGCRVPQICVPDSQCPPRVPLRLLVRLQELVLKRGAGPPNLCPRLQLPPSGASCC